jgi:hypothetical protein
LQCANQIAPSVGKIGNSNPGWFAQNYLGNDVATAVGIFTGPDSAGSAFSALFSNFLDNGGGPTSLVGLVTGLVGSQPIVSGSKIGIRYTSNGAPYGVDFVQSFSKTLPGKIGFSALSYFGLAKLGFDAATYGAAAYYCAKAQ